MNERSNSGDHLRKDDPVADQRPGKSCWSVANDDHELAARSIENSEGKAGHFDQMLPADERRDSGDSWKEIAMTTFFEGLGLIIILLGAAAADSQSVVLPGVMIGAGMLLMLLGYWSERRYF